jgi:hypothetical protein
MQVRRIFGAGRYATVAATVALVAALGGTSYAASTIIKPNSVGTRQLKNNAVTSAKVKNHSLLAADFKLGQLPAGPKGAQGDRGPAGVAGPAGLTGPKGATGDKGAKGDPGTQGVPGASGGAGFFASDVPPVPFATTSDANVTVQTLALAAGKYIITARTMAHNTAPATDSSLNCTLNAGGTPIDSTGSGQDIAAGGGVDTSVTLNNAVDLAAPGDATLVCHSSGTSGSYLERHITAVEVTALNGA